MEHNLLKSLFNNAKYLENQAVLRRTLFSSDYANIFDLLKAAHDRYQHDITPDEIFSIWSSNNPVATTSEIHEVRDVIDELRMQKVSVRML